MSAPTFTADAFRHLARSSPWRWQSVRFELHRKFPNSVYGGSGNSWVPLAVTGAEVKTTPGIDERTRGLLEDKDPTLSINCWVRRPGALRVETLEGKLLASTTKINESRDSLFISGNRKPWLLQPSLVNPVKDSQGFVVRRPEARYGEPAYGSGRAAAALDPVELTGERPVPLEAPFANVAEIADIAVVTHHGRDAVEAVLTPNSSYRPLFADAPLLFPGRTAVRIDLETGICVASQSLDGDSAGAGHWMVLLGIDEYMLDDLFEEVSMGLTDVRAHIPWELGPDQ
ncbi:hypothetical protein [Arthrobacter psychrochitiniphilus]|uniref:Uncharacterized protein n=1 Tax=Arthrobacter psychrochitiniphilus TaxID=291045 RepID=A0A2V3DXX9_9MICC|nr:hypothetical protein [Arthrobacter psychrochitiniphilus]NYG16494.1 hypothetical protein [Arthrobacter psychrochitiniphilus]PXA69370.1 hypothetical protein CVS29_02085 [Arthrobacter psychrochitiniphilus]